MKKLISILSAIGLTATASTSVVSCAPKHKVVAKNVVPKNGWPPVDKDFLKLWLDYNASVQYDLSKAMDKMFSVYSNEYIKEFNKIRISNKNLRNTPGYDQYGVPDETSNNILLDVAASQGMADYEMSSLRLYYTEIIINKLEGVPNRLRQDELFGIWAMKWFRSFPFYNSVQIHLNDPNPIIHQVGINFNFYDFGRYVQVDNSGNPLWNLPPNPASNPGSFKPIVKIQKEYYAMADSIYNELFMEGN